MRDTALFDWRKFDVDGSNIDLLLLAAADGCERVSNAGKLAHIDGYTFGKRGRGSKSISFGSPHVEFKLSLVVNRQEVFANEHKKGHDTDDDKQTSHHYRPAMGHRPR